MAANKRLVIRSCTKKSQQITPATIEIPCGNSDASITQRPSATRTRPSASSPQRQRIDAVLDLPARGPRACPACRHRQTGTARLHDDRPGVGFRNDEMHGRAGDLHAGAQRLAVRIEPGKRRQQGRMDVEHAAVPALHELRA